MGKAMGGVGAPVRTVVAGVCALAMGLALAGCTRPGSEVSGTPTSPWTEEQQRSIDAVQRYIDVWTEISQNVDTTETADWNRIYEVAADPLAQNHISYWTVWSADGQHLVGKPIITVNSVRDVFYDGQGYKQNVHICYDATSAYLYNADGSRVENRGLDRRLVTYVVVNSGTGEYRVTDLLMEDEEC